MTLEIYNKTPIDLVRHILSFNDQIVSNDGRIIGKIDKHDDRINMLMRKPLIKQTGVYYFMDCYYMAWLGKHQLLFGYHDRNMKIVFRARGIKYSRDHDPYTCYTHILR
jgi:hypothetical protein